MKLEDITAEGNNYLDHVLKIKPEKTKLNLLDTDEWKNFCFRTGYDVDSRGIFLPRNSNAYIPIESKFSGLSLFHEYFGHGFFCEYCPKGRILESLERKLIEEEKDYFGENNFSLKDLKAFRESNPTFQTLKQTRQEGLDSYEGFAIWSEYNLSRELNIGENFEDKYGEYLDYLPGTFHRIVGFQEEFGTKATFYNVGFPKYYGLREVSELLEDIYGKEKIKNIRLAILYGSKKPYSDIDVFVVSDNLKPIDERWLDVRVYGEEDFEDKIGLFDISVCDPVSSGEFLMGDRNYLENIRERLRKQQITKKAIDHNISQSNQQKEWALTYPLGSEVRRKGLLYSETFMRNSHKLKEGKRELTKKKLLKI